MCAVFKFYKCYVHISAYISVLKKRTAADCQENSKKKKKIGSNPTTDNRKRVA